MAAAVRWRPQCGQTLLQQACSSCVVETCLQPLTFVSRLAEASRVLALQSRTTQAEQPVLSRLACLLCPAGSCSAQAVNSSSDKDQATHHAQRLALVGGEAWLCIMLGQQRDGVQGHALLPGVPPHGHPDL